MTQRDFAAETATWHKTRIDTLTAADGWLSVTGLLWVEPGEWRFGSAADNALVIEGLPPHAGILTLHADGAAEVALAKDSGGTIGGEAGRSGPIHDDSDPPRP